MTQPQAVIETIEMLGGVATLNQINQNVFFIEDCSWGSKTPFASIRRIVRNTKGIYRIKPGLYALESHRQELENNGIIVQDEHNQDSEIVKTFNHSYYQGLLLEMGKMRHLDTFVPDQDKNKQFLNQAVLGDLRTIQAIPEYSYPQLVKRSSTIDVIWFNERSMPSDFYEVEHTTDIKNSLTKFYELQDFNAGFFIVADASRKKEYEDKLHVSLFSPIENRVKFLNYKQVVDLYEGLKKVDGSLW